MFSSLSGWFESLLPLEQVLACIAIPATLILVIQTVLSLFGLGDDHDTDHDFDHDLDSDHDFDHDHDFGHLDHDFDHDHDFGHLDHDFSHDHDFGHLDHDFDHDHDLAHDHSLDHDSAQDHDTDTDRVGPGLNLHLLSFRSIIAFLAVFGWGTLALSRAGHPWLASLILGLLMGGASMFLVALVTAWFVSMQSNGALEYSNAVGLSGTVYLPIPPQRSGEGKVNVVIQERYTECSAVSDEEEPLSTGTEVIVVGVTRADQLIVIRK